MRAPWTSRFSELFSGRDPLFTPPEKERAGDGFLCILCVILLLVLKLVWVKNFHYGGSPLDVGPGANVRVIRVVQAHAGLMLGYYLLFIAVSSTGFVSGITAIIRETNGKATRPMVLLAYLVMVWLWLPVMAYA